MQSQTSMYWWKRLYLYSELDKFKQNSNLAKLLKFCDKSTRKRGSNSLGDLIKKSL